MNSKFYVFIVAFLHFISVNAQNFTSSSPSTGYNTTIAGLKQGSIAPIDVDNDGKMDFFLSGYDALFNSFTKLYFNTGTDFYDGSILITFPGSGRGKVAVGDVNNDGFADVLITGEQTTPTSTYIAKLYTNSGSNFTEVTGTPFVGVYDGDAAFSDVNNDGFLDVLIIGDETGTNTNTAKLYTNSGSNFTLVAGTPFTGAKIGAVAFADVNNDTFKDVIITGLNSPGTPITKLYTNSGGNFTEVAGTPFPAVSGSKVAFFDANGDNKPDVFLSGMDNALTSVSKLYTNSGTNFIEVPTPAITPLNSGELLIADFNNDNKPDIYLSGSDDSFSTAIALYTNTGGNFSLVENAPFANDFSETVAVAFDINNDGKKDIFATGGAINSGDNLAKVYFNIANTQITGQPVSATVCGGTLHTFGVTATGTGLTYLWSNGATTQSINTSVAGTYSVTVTGMGGTVVSNTASLILRTATQISVQPTSQSVCPGVTATFSVSATGLNLSYLWSNGATTPNIQTSVLGNYMITVSGTCGNAISNSVMLSSLPITNITSISSGLFVANGSKTIINVEATGNQLSYLWSTGATTASLTNVGAGEYFVTVTGTCGTKIERTLVANIVLAASNSGYNFQSSTVGIGNPLSPITNEMALAIAPDGRIYVSESDKNQISVFSRNGDTYSLQATFGSGGSGNNQFSEPLGMAFGSDGKIYVADYNNHRISVWTRNGNVYTPLTSFGSKGSGNNQFSNPTSVTIATDGKIFVTDYFNNRISIWTQNGNTYSPFAIFGANQLNYPSDIAIGADGKIFVSESSRGRISVYTVNNNSYSLLTTFGTYGENRNQLYGPFGVEISNDGKIYISDTFNNRISVWTQSGNNFGNLTTFGTYGTGAGGLYLPYNLAFFDKNTILVSESGNSRFSIWKVPPPIFYFQATFDITAPTTFTGSTATLTWPTIPGVTSYCIRISNDKNLQSLTTKTVCGLTGNTYSYNPNSPSGRSQESLEEYYWQVIGVDSAGNYSQWSETQTFLVNATNTSLASAENGQSLQVYPNPLEGDLLTIENVPVGKSVEIANLLGHTILNEKAASGTLQIDVSSLSKGIYFIKAGGKTVKFIKQ